MKLNLIVGDQNDVVASRIGRNTEQRSPEQRRVEWARFFYLLVYHELFARAGRVSAEQSGDPLPEDPTLEQSIDHVNKHVPERILLSGPGEVPPDARSVAFVDGCRVALEAFRFPSSFMIVPSLGAVLVYDGTSGAKSDMILVRATDGRMGLASDEVRALVNHAPIAGAARG